MPTTKAAASGNTPTSPLSELCPPRYQKNLQHGLACFSALRRAGVGWWWTEPALGRVPGSQARRQFLASVPAKAERTNAWHWADYTGSDFTILPLACFLSERLPPPRGCWDVGSGGAVSQPAHGGALFLLKPGVEATGPPSCVLTVRSALYPLLHITSQ